MFNIYTLDNWAAYLDKSQPNRDTWQENFFAQIRAEIIWKIHNNFFFYQSIRIWSALPEKLANLT